MATAPTVPTAPVAPDAPSNTTPEYEFTLPVKLIDALDARVRAHLGPLYASITASQEAGATDVQVTVATTRALTADEQAGLAAVVAAYVDPACWLTFDHTENFCMDTDTTNGTDAQSAAVLATFIISPYLDRGADGTVLDSIKSILRYDTPDLAALADWDAAASPMTVRVELYDYTHGAPVRAQTVDASDIVAAWREQARGGQAGPAAAVWRSLQLYGLMSVCPTSDCIWQFRLSVSDPRLHVAMGGLQKLYYTAQYA